MRVLSVLMAFAILPSMFADQSINQPTDQSINQSPNQLTDQSINQSIDQSASRLGFELLTKSAPWSARSVFGLSLFNRSINGLNPLTGARQVLSSPVMLVHGGQVWDQSINQSISSSNDVWASKDGKLWLLSAGITNDDSLAPGNAAFTSFTNKRSPTIAIDQSTNQLYRLGGQNYEGKQGGSYDVWASTDGVIWDDVSGNSWSPFDGERVDASSVVDASGRIYIVGGSLPKRVSVNQPNDQSIHDQSINDESVNDQSINQYRSDVWMSTNGGLEWREQASESKFGDRSMMSLVSLPINQPIDQSTHASMDDTQALILLGGQDDQSTNNEVWMSIDRGVSWTMTSTRAPWGKRSSSNVLTTKDGLIVLVGGVPDQSTRQPINPRSINQPYNDVWVSMDGGWTWGECTSLADWSPRRDHQSIIDADGYLYVMGGYSINQPIDDASIDQSTPIELNDIWRSSVSFFDLRAVSETCNVPVPQCGSGLKCLTGSDTVLASDGSFVSCSQCQVYNVQSRVIFWVVTSFAIAGCTAFAVTLLALICVVKRQKRAAAPTQSAWSDVEVSSVNMSTSQSHQETNDQSINQQQWGPSDRGHEPIYIQTNDGYEQTQPSSDFTPLRN